MVVDVGIVRKYIKPKADSTLYNMRKVDLIEYVRTLEHNYNVAVSFNENQAKYIESLGFKGVVRCKDCKHLMYSAIYKQHFCTNIYGLRNICISKNDFCSHGERREGE